jgi:hypothetical protein
MLWNGGYVEIDGLNGRVDSEVRSGGGVRGELTIASFRNSAKTGGVTVNGSAVFDTDVCPNYPISGSLTVSKDGQDYTVTFTDDCDGTFDAPNQGQTGDVSFRLTWNTPEDLDLHVKEPNGTEIYYGHTTSSTGSARRRLQLSVRSELQRGRERVLAGRRRAARHLHLLGHSLELLQQLWRHQHPLLHPAGLRGKQRRAHDQRRHA